MVFTTKESLYRRRNPQNLYLNKIFILSKKSKRHVKLQFWIWKKQQEQRNLGMFRAKLRFHKRHPFSHLHHSVKTKTKGRITRRFGSKDVTASKPCKDVVSGARAKQGDMCLIPNCLSALPAAKDISVAPITFNRENADFSEFNHSDNSGAQNESVCPVVLEQNLITDVILNDDKCAQDIYLPSSKIPSSDTFNISTEKLGKTIQDFLNNFKRKYGSFIPLRKQDILEHLKEKLNKDFNDREKMILKITKEQRAKLVETMPYFQVIYNKHILTLDDLSTLANENWLNDQVINMYGELIMDSAQCKVHFLNSFFYHQLKTNGYGGVKRWTKQVDLFSKNLLLVPIHLEVHWCLVTADMVKKQVYLYDSQGARLQRVAKNILKYLLNEAKEKKQLTFENGWNVSLAEEIPQQTNENDCGVFVLEYSRYLALSKPLTFTQRDIPKIRKRIYKELCECKLHDEG